MTRPPYWLVMPAAGQGRRMGGSEGLPKQYLPLAGRTVIEHALAPFLGDPACQGAVVALAAGDTHFATLPVARDPRVIQVTGGAERRDSVQAGLVHLAARVGDDPWVLVHDAARPCLPAADLAALLAVLVNAPQGALLALPIVDTVKRARADGTIEATVPRMGLWRAQTPQAFRLRRLMEALTRSADATDEASAVEGLGDHPRLVIGSPDNLKITAPGDLAPAARQLGGGSSMTSPRVGFGTDVHAFGPGDHVWLGGLRVAHDHGLIAHSDGDVLLHALCDALLGAAGLGDIGQHFPDTDPTWKGVASIGFLRHVLVLLRERGWAVINVDLTLIGEAPRLSPHREAIRSHLAGELGLALDCVNLKATTTERLGFTGRREGLAAQAVALIGPAR